LHTATAAVGMVGTADMAGTVGIMAAMEDITAPGVGITVAGDITLPGDIVAAGDIAVGDMAAGVVVYTALAYMALVIQAVCGYLNTGMEMGI